MMANCTLQVQKNSGDVATWDKAVFINSARDVIFRCGTHAADAASAQWQVLEITKTGTKTVAKGLVGRVVPGNGYSQFSIDFSKFAAGAAPAVPQRYLVSVTLENASSQPDGGSPDVRVTYATAEVPVMTGWGFHPEAVNPMRVGLNINRIHCLKGQGDNVFLYVAAVAVDGSHLDVLDPANSRAQVWIPDQQPHNDLTQDPGSDNMTDGQTFGIPAPIQGTAFDIQPIGYKFPLNVTYEDAADATTVGMIVVAMRHSSVFGTTDQAADVGRTALRDSLQNHLDKAVQDYLTSALQAQLNKQPAPKFDKKSVLSALPQQVGDDVKSAITTYVKSSGAYLWSGATADEEIAAQFVTASYADLKQNGGYIPFTLDLDGLKAGAVLAWQEGPPGSHYTVDGSIGIEPIYTPAGAAAENNADPNLLNRF
jgi:hypothetical protein